MPLFLMRHGRTALNGTFCGTSNPPLSLRGKSDARSAARAFAGFSIDVCYFSPQLRAKETAAIICRRHPGVRRIPSPLLREIGFGAWEGLKFSNVEAQWPALAKAWAKEPLKVRVPGGESFPSLRRRVKQFLSQTNKSLKKTQNVLIVAHAGTLSAIIMELLKRPNNEFPDHLQPTASIRRVQGRSVKWVHRPC